MKAKCPWCGRRVYVKQDGTVGQHPVHHYPSVRDSDRGHILTSAGDGKVRVQDMPARCFHVCIGTGQRP